MVREVLVCVAVAVVGCGAVAEDAPVTQDGGAAGAVAASVAVGGAGGQGGASNVNSGAPFYCIPYITDDLPEDDYWQFIGVGDSIPDCEFCYAWHPERNPWPIGCR